MAISEYICRICRHDFPWFSSDGPQPHCPRCGGTGLILNPWLLLSPDAEGLSDEEHFEVQLAA